MSMIRYESVVLRCRGNGNDTVTVPYTLAIAHSGFVLKVFQDRERRHENNNVVDIDAPPWFVWSPQTLNSIAWWIRRDEDGDSAFNYDNDKVVEIAKAADYLDMAGLIEACAEALAPQLCEHPGTWKPEFAGLLRDYERVCAAIVDAADVSQLSVDRLQKLQQGFQYVGENMGTHPILRRIDKIDVRNPGWDFELLVPHLRSLQVLNIHIEKERRCCREPWEIHEAGKSLKKFNWYAVKSIIENSLPSTVRTLGIYEKQACRSDCCVTAADCSVCRSSSQIRQFLDLADKTHIRDFTHWNECSYCACARQIVGIRSFPTQLQHLCLHGVLGSVEFPLSLTSLKLLRYNNCGANLSKLVHLRHLQIKICWLDDQSTCMLYYPLPPNISKLHFSGNSCTRINWTAFSHLTIRELHFEGITMVFLRDIQQMHLLIAKISKDLESLIIEDSHYSLYNIFFNDSSMVFPRVTMLSLTYTTFNIHMLPLALLYPSLRKLRIGVLTPSSDISFSSATKISELEVEIASKVTLNLSVAFQTVERLSLVIRNSCVHWSGLPKKNVTTLAIDLDLGVCNFEDSTSPNYFDEGRFPQYFENLTRLVIKRTDTAMKFLKSNVSAIQCVEIAQSLTCMLYIKQGVMLLLPKHVKRPKPCVKSNNPAKDLGCVFQSLEYTRCKLENITIYVAREE